VSAPAYRNVQAAQQGLRDRSWGVRSRPSKIGASVVQKPSCFAGYKHRQTFGRCRQKRGGPPFDRG